MTEDDRVREQFLDVASREFTEAVEQKDWPVSEAWGRVYERLLRQAESADA